MFDLNTLTPYDQDAAHPGSAAPVYDLGVGSRGDVVYHRVSDFACQSHDVFQTDCDACRSNAGATAEHLRLAQGIEVVF